MSTMTRDEFVRRTAGVGLAIYLGASLKGTPALPAAEATGAIEVSGAGYARVVPVGTMTQFVGDTLPAGWVVCDGSTVNISEYPSLYRLIANAHGGSRWRRKFRVPALPDMRGRVVGALASPVQAADPAPYLVAQTIIKAA